MRVTQGRAQAPCGPAAVQEIQEAMKKLLPGKAMLQMHISPEEAGQHPKLFQALVCSTFGVAASNISVGKFELQLMPCIRAAYAGTRFITVILLNDVLKFLGQRDPKEAVNLASVQDFLFKCTEGDIEALQKEGGAFCATVGPNDVMYFPAGCMVSHRVHSQDIAGVRLGVLTQDMYMQFLRIAKLQDENGCIEEALKFLASKNVEGKDESLAQEEEAKQQEAKRLEEERKAQEQEAKKQEAERVAAEDDKRKAEAEEEKRKAKEDEEAKRKEAEETRKAKEEAKRKEAARLAEEEKQKAEEEAKRKEGERLAEQQRKAEAEEEEAKRKEAERLAEQQRKAEEEAKKEARAKEAARLAEEEKQRAEEEAKRKEAERTAVEDEKARKEAEHLAQETPEAEEKAKSSAKSEEAERWAKESQQRLEEAQAAAKEKAEQYARRLSKSGASPKAEPKRKA